MAAIDRIDEHLTSNPRTVEQAGRDVVAAMKAHRAAEAAQRLLEGESLRGVPNVTQDEIEAAGKRVKAARLTFLAALAVLEKEVDR